MTRSNLMSQADALTGTHSHDHLSCDADGAGDEMVMTHGDAEITSLTYPY